jgi:putative addiction module killer protein
MLLFLAGPESGAEGDVAEMRMHFGPGYRLYFTRRGQIVVVLLCGGNKSTQTKDIRRAVKLSSQIGEVN